MKHKILIISITLIAGIFFGWLFFHSSENSLQKDSSTEYPVGTIWTCSMHPEIRQTEPGNCPICGMLLIPLVQSNVSSGDPDAIKLSKDAAQLANIMTTVVTKQKASKELRLYGKVQADERLLQNQVSHFDGRIEQLMVNFTGEKVIEGQTLAKIYSPELITAQKELLETAATKQLQPDIYEATREKLRQWRLTESQISSVETTGKIQNTIDIVSGSNGIVTSKLVNQGDYISKGTVLYEIADLSRVWIMFDAYESDLIFLKSGDKVTYTIQSLPGDTFSGSIAFIDPVIDPVTRVAKVRVESDNRSGLLKPEMFATGVVSSALPEFKNNLVIPKSAVLWTGKRSVVYIKQQGSDEPEFKVREVVLGPMLGESYIVTDGLNDGDEIVTNGTFSVDAAAQLEGKPSMMNPKGGAISSMPGMDMSGNTKQADQAMQGMDMSGK